MKQRVEIEVIEGGRDQPALGHQQYDGSKKEVLRNAFVREYRDLYDVPYIPHETLCAEFEVYYHSFHNYSVKDLRAAAKHVASGGHLSQYDYRFGPGYFEEYRAPSYTKTVNDYRLVIAGLCLVVLFWMLKY